jgi:DnaJ-class molecular chaperone
MDSLYELLRVEQGADRESIKRAFYRLAKEHHPDISKNSVEFIKILNAYETLTDDNKRELYDSTLEMNGPVVLSKDRLLYAVSLSDIVQKPYYRAAGSRRKRGLYRFKEFDVCVNVTQSEIRSGAVIYVDVPAHVICPVCRGNHVDCRLCTDRGYVLRAVPVPVNIPKNISNEEVFSLPLRRQRGRYFAYFMISELLVKIKMFQG